MAAEKQTIGSADPGESFETLLRRLEGIVGQLEAGERPLDESLALYESGVSTLKRCHGILDKAEKRIRILLQDAEGNAVLKDVEVPERGVKKGSTRTAAGLEQDDLSVTKQGSMPEVQKKVKNSSQQNIDSEPENPQNPPSSTKLKSKSSPDEPETGDSLFGSAS